MENGAFNISGEAGNATTIVARIDPTRLESLQALLAHDGDPRTSSVIDLSRSEYTHFARWAIVPMSERDPAWLVFESNHDGRREEYIDEVIAIGGDALAAMYAHCDGHPRKSELRAYLLHPERILDYEAFYRAYPSWTVGEVRSALSLAERVRMLLDDGREKLASLSPAAIHLEVQRALLAEGFRSPRPRRVPAVPLRFLTDALQDAVGEPGPARLRATGLLAMILLGPIVLLALLERFAGDALAHVPAYASAFLAVVLVTILASIVVVERAPPPSTPQPSFANENLLAAQEDFVTQNQITHVSTIKAGWVRGALLRLVLGTINVLARITFTKGDLGGIPSIHFARWAILPDRRLLFMSNFDGSWDSYLGDFIDKASAGLSSIWSNTEWFPKTSFLLWGGARAGHAFKVWTRAGQVPTQIWYTAYPHSSIQNIRNALKLWHEVFRPASDPDIGTWLTDFH